jgi:cell division protein FtsB
MARFLRILVLLLVAAAVIDGIVGDRGLLAMLRARHEFEQLEAAIARQRAENARLREEVRRLRDDPGTIEEVARRELGLMRPGEKVFIIKDLPPQTP